MADGLTVDTSQFESAFRRFAALSARSMEDELKRQAASVLREGLKITPPRVYGDSVAAGLARAKSKIGADLRGGGSGYGRRRAGVFTVLADDLIAQSDEAGTAGKDYTRLWVTKAGRVYGAQKHFYRPQASVDEMRAHHKQYFRGGRMSSAGTYTRDIGRWKWIDQMVVGERAYRRYLAATLRRVGWYTGGWGRAAAGLGVSMPAYGRRHAAAAPGSFEFRTGTDWLRVTLINSVGYDRVDRDMRRRMQWAVRAQANKMERQIPFLVKAAARAARV